MHNASPSCSKVISVDKYLFDTNLMRDFLVRSITSLQTEGYLGRFQISMMELFNKLTNICSKSTIETLKKSLKYVKS